MNTQCEEKKKSRLLEAFFEGVDLYSNLDVGFFHLHRRALTKTQTGSHICQGQMNHFLIAVYQQNSYKCVRKARKKATGRQKVLIFYVYF